MEVTKEMIDLLKSTWRLCYRQAQLTLNTGLRDLTTDDYDAAYTALDEGTDALVKLGNLLELDLDGTGYPEYLQDTRAEEEAAEEPPAEAETVSPTKEVRVDPWDKLRS